MAVGTIWLGVSSPSPMEEKGQIALGRTQEAHSPACLLQARQTQNWENGSPSWDIQLLGVSSPGAEPWRRPALPAWAECECMCNLGPFQGCRCAWSQAGRPALLLDPRCLVSASEFQGRPRRGLGHVPVCASVLRGCGRG